MLFDKQSKQGEGPRGRREMRPIVLQCWLDLSSRPPLAVVVIDLRWATVLADVLLIPDLDIKYSLGNTRAHLGPNGAGFLEYGATIEGDPVITFVPSTVDGLALVFHLHYPPNAVGGREFEVEVALSVIKPAPGTAVRKEEIEKAGRSGVEVGVTSRLHHDAGKGLLKRTKVAPGGGPVQVILKEGQTAQLP